jgi:triphosphoribosyl-dephospho-CoA synthetase
MSDVDSGITLRYRIREINTSQSQATFLIAIGYYVGSVWQEKGTQQAVVSAADLATIMSVVPDGILTRREDLLKAWSDYFIARGDISGTLVASLGI